MMCLAKSLQKLVGMPNDLVHCRISIVGCGQHSTCIIIPDI